jgi:hypothetical protein
MLSPQDPMARSDLPAIIFAPLPWLAWAALRATWLHPDQFWHLRLLASADVI